MKEKRSKTLIILFMVLTLVLVQGCRKENEADNRRESSVNEVKNNMMTIDLYYVDADRRDYVIENYLIDQMATAETMIDGVMAKLVETDETPNEYDSPVPEGMVYQRYSYDGKGIVTIVFNMDYENVSTYDITICKAAFTNTLCQLEFVNAVTFEMVNLINEEEIVDETYNENDFARLKNVLASEYPTYIYYPYGDGSRLKAVETMLDMSQKETLEYQIIEKLKNANTEGYISPFATDVVVNYITTESGVCTINLNDKFLKGQGTLDHKIIIYAIVNSLLSLDFISEVHFEIDGADGTDIEGEDLSIGYKADYSFSD